MTIAVCDDEPEMAEALAQETETFFRQAGIGVTVRRCEDGQALLRLDPLPEVILLDIRMAQPDGLETARVLRERGFSGFLIFVTVLRECVFRAFEVQAFDYLVKPLRPEEFRRTMGRLLDALRGGQDARLLLRRGNGFEVVPFADILYCEVIDRKVYLHLRGGAVLDCYSRLEALSGQLDGRFFRCHRSYLVNLQHLTGCKGGRAQLTGGGSVPVSRLRAGAFADAAAGYLARQGWLA